MNLFWLDRETCRTRRAASALTGSTFTTLARKGGRAGSSPVWPSKQLPNIRPRQQENRAPHCPQMQLWVVTGRGLTLPRGCTSSTGVSGWWKQRKASCQASGTNQGWARTPRRQGASSRAPTAPPPPPAPKELPGTQRERPSREVN